jgi:CubicO group peptidase (beta-lactamase class C family)
LSEIIRRVSGQTLDRFCKDRIFGPLGMKDTTCLRDNTKRSRIAVRGPGVPGGSVEGDSFAGLEGDFLQEAPWGFTSVGTTASDLAVFAQAHLNGGTQGGVRILSPASVREMTRNQIPGIEAHLGAMSIDASWGLGWMIQSTHRWRRANASLNPTNSFYHLGAGGIGLWIDPESQTLAVFLGICQDLINNDEELRTPRDLFLNMIMASILD